MTAEIFSRIREETTFLACGLFVFKNTDQKYCHNLLFSLSRFVLFLDLGFTPSQDLVKVL